MVLGELIREAHGKVTGTRILDNRGRTEVTVQEEGTILGSKDSTIATFSGTPRPDGTIYGEVNRMLVTETGEAIISFGSGLAKPKGKPPALSVRGPLYYQTNSRKLAELNGMVGVYEVEIEEDGSFKLKEWEWK